MPSDPLASPSMAIEKSDGVIAHLLRTHVRRLPTPSPLSRNQILIDFSLFNFV